MQPEDRKLKEEWLDVTSDKILQEMGVIYKAHTRYLADTDTNLIYHGLLVETIFYKFFVSMIESVSDEGKDAQMEDIIANMRHFRTKVRNEEEMWKAIQEQKAQ